MRSLSLSQKIVAANFSLMAFIAAIVGTVLFFNFRHLAVDEAMNDLSDLTSRDIPKLAIDVKDMQLAVVQVQQFLTDVSATRGRDGLDDGFEEAAKNAKRFAALAKETRGLAGKLGYTETAEAIDRVQAKFHPYYEHGQRMAELYVSQGPSAGNKLMGEFDKVADELNEAMQELIARTNQHSQVGQKAIDEKTDEAIAQLHLINTITMGIGGSALVMGFGILLLVRVHVSKPLNRIIQSMLILAEGKAGQRPPYLDRVDEIGRIAKAIETFRVNACEAVEKDREMQGLRASAEETRNSALMELCEMLEADLDSTVGEVLSISSDAAKKGTSAAAQARSIASEAMTVASASEEASVNVTSVSSAAEELSVTGREIAARAADTAKFATRAAEEAAQASRTVADLKNAAEQISTVVSTISEVAAQTNLLALNATIEAARAGDLGKGFAVVAHEVKALAHKTAIATEDIARRIENICAATKHSVDAISNVAGAVNDINGVSAAVAAAAEEQEATLREVSRSLQQASAGVSEVARNVAYISDRSSEIEQSSTLVSELVNGTNGQVSELRANLIVSLRQSSAGDRRSEYRRPLSLPASIRAGAVTVQGNILDLSEGGLRFRADKSDFELVEGRPVTAEAQALGSVTGTVVAVGKTSVHLQFHDLTEQQEKMLGAFLRSVDAADQGLIEAAKAGALEISGAFEAAIERREISLAQMFDFRYRTIPGTNPEQFESSFTSLCDRVLPPIQEPILRRDPRIVFCAAADLKCFVPTHNAQFSKPQRPNEPAWNADNSRNRRFFKDRTGMIAARNRREFLMQTYERNMGGRTTATLKEIDVPIFVKGRHWGGLRLAFNAQ